MSEIETLPSTGILEFVKRHPVVSHQVSAAPIRPRSGAGLPSRIAVVGNYLPRQCGIATFTTDLCEAISTEYGSPRLFAVPVNEFRASRISASQETKQTTGVVRQLLLPGSPRVGSPGCRQSRRLRSATWNVGEVGI